MKTTKYWLAISLGLMALVAPSTAHANTIVFDASGAFTDGTILTGTMITDSGQITSLSFSTTGSQTLGPFTLLANSGVTSLLDSNGAVQISADFLSLNDTLSNSLTLYLLLPGPPQGPFLLSGYTGGPLCGTNPLNCNGFGGLLQTTLSTASGVVSLVSGNFTAVPEPSSVLLLGTGLLGLMGMGLYKKRLA